MAINIYQTCVKNAMKYIAIKYNINLIDHNLLNFLEKEFNCVYKPSFDQHKPFCVSGELIFKNNNHETAFLLKWN